MNLYSIDILHAAPKDTATAIVTYVLAEDAEVVYEWLKNDPQLENGIWITTCWKDKEEDNEEFKKKMLEIGGEFYDEDADFSDAYYGITYYGWTLIKKDVYVDELKPVMDLGIILQL